MVVLLLVLLVLGVAVLVLLVSVDVARWLPSPSPSPLPSSAAAPLSHAELQSLLLLSGQTREGVLSASALSTLRAAVRLVADALLQGRPALQSALWRGHCKSYVPCPHPSNSTLTAWQPNTSSGDDDWVQPLATRRTLADWWSASLSPPPSNASAVDAAVLFPQHPNGAGGAYAPGESAASQALAQDFQVLLYERQHPHDCANASFLLYDHLQLHSGFGQYQHTRAIHLLHAVRLGRVLIEVENDIAYPLAYSDCTRKHGLGGCDLFLNTTHCTLPDDWRQLLQQERAQYAELHGAFDGDWAKANWAQRHTYLRHRRYLLFDEAVMGDRYEVVHGNLSPYSQADFVWDVQQGHYPLRFAAMPECWWYGQVLTYNLRMTTPALIRLLEELARTLQLPEPTLTAQRVFDYATRLASSPDHTDFWWLAMQALKWTWQLHAVIPQPFSTNSSEPSPSPPDTVASAVPLLGYTFIRHGDKGSEAPLHAEAEYLHLMQHVQQVTGLSIWYVGADDLLSADVIREELGNASALTVLSSSLVDSIPDRAGHPLSHGFSMRTARTLTDAERLEILWRTLVDVGMAQLADVHVSSWTSNHPRLVYKLAQALSDERHALPFVAIEAGYASQEATNMHLQTKRRLNPHCREP